MSRDVQNVLQDKLMLHEQPWQYPSYTHMLSTMSL